MKIPSPLLLRRAKGHPTYYTTPLYAPATGHPKSFSLHSKPPSFLPTVFGTCSGCNALSTFCLGLSYSLVPKPSLLMQTYQGSFSSTFLPCPNQSLVWGSPYAAPALYTKSCLHPSLCLATRAPSSWVAPCFFSGHSCCSP